MAQCKYCGCSSWFLSVDKDSLCSNCRHIVGMDVASRKSTLQEYSRLANETQNPQSRIARWDQMLKQLEALAKYEERGIPTIEQSPGAMMGDIRAKRDELIQTTAQADINDILGTIEQTPVPDKKIAYYSKILLRLAEYKKKMSDAAPLEALEKKLKTTLHQIRLSIPLEKARSAEQHGKEEKALQHYREALEFLKTNDPERAALSKHIPIIEEKIRTLGG